MSRSILHPVLNIALLLSFTLSACASPTENASPADTAAAAPAVEVAATQPPEATVASTQAPEANVVAGSVSFSKDVLPILQNRCVSCHGGSRTSKGLDLKSYDSVMAGSENGPVLTAGDAAHSPLVSMVVSGKMPRRKPRLPDAEIQILTDWVNAGAPNN